jgi:hypothetical protein
MYVCNQFGLPPELLPMPMPPLLYEHPAMHCLAGADDTEPLPDTIFSVPGGGHSAQPSVVLLSSVTGIVDVTNPLLLHCALIVDEL